MTVTASASTNEPNGSPTRCATTSAWYTAATPVAISAKLSNPVISAFLALPAAVPVRRTLAAATPSAHQEASQWSPPPSSYLLDLANHTTQPPTSAVTVENSSAGSCVRALRGELFSRSILVPGCSCSLTTDNRQLTTDSGDWQLTTAFPSPYHGFLSMRHRRRKLWIALAVLLSSAPSTAVLLRKRAAPDVVRLLPNTDAILYVDLEPVRLLSGLGQEAA